MYMYMYMYMYKYMYVQEYYVSTVQSIQQKKKNTLSCPGQDLNP